MIIRIEDGGRLATAWAQATSPTHQADSTCEVDGAMVPCMTVTVKDTHGSSNTEDWTDVMIQIPHVPMSDTPGAQ